MLGLCVAVGVVATRPLLAQDESADATTTFLVVRHAERDGNLDKLTKIGVERAQRLAAVGSALNVQAIYSTNTKRTTGTVQPLAKTTETEIETYAAPSKNWIASLKQKHSGQVVLIVGHSNTAGVIAGMLANDEPFEIKHNEYDAIFVIQVSKSGTRSMRLRYGSRSGSASSADPDKMGELKTTHQ